MAAAQSSDGSKSLISMDLKPILSFDTPFTDWTTARLVATLGAPASQRLAASAPPLQGHAGWRAMDSISLQTAETLRAVVEALNKGPHVASGGTSSAITNNNKHIYSEYKLAALQGFCGVAEPQGIPRLWLTFQSARKMEEVRANLKEGMQAFARAQNCEIDGGIFFEKKTLDNLVELKFNPGGGTVVLKSAGMGLSILTCRPVSAAERELALQREEALLNSKGNWTLEEAFKLKTSNARHPPSTFHKLRVLTSMYASLLFVLFGTKCDQFEKVWNIHNIMKDEDVEEKRQDFTATLCRQIVWAILDDGRGFFNKRLHPEKFKVDPSLIPFPHSLLDAIYPNIRWQEPINRRMPIQWTTQGLSQDTHHTRLVG